MWCFHKWENTGKEFSVEIIDITAWGNPARPAYKKTGHRFEQKCVKCGKRRFYGVSV